VGPGADGIVVVLVARIPAAGVASFLAYEAAVLPRLGMHGGVLERRLRRASEAGGEVVEVHVVRFASASGLAAYRADPARAAHAQIEVLELEDAPVEELVDPAPGTKP
jgi:hypothetical protein